MKDALGLELNKKEKNREYNEDKNKEDNEDKEDDSLYNAMIWALSIGIIVVIVTLFLTRPAPESFTELYFNNHTLLPEYVNLGNKYNYSFTIHNLENKNTTYNYTITTELYTLDYSCQAVDLYLDTINQTRYPTKNIDIETRTTETNDPLMIIKENNYNITFNYVIYSGNQLVFKLLDEKNQEKYAIVINHEYSNVYLISKDGIKKYEFTPEDITQHTFKLIVYNNSMTLRLDKNDIQLDIPKDYTRGYPSVETTNTYAELNNFVIERRGTKQNINIRIADAKYDTIQLSRQAQHNIEIDYTRFLGLSEDIVYNKIYYQPIVRTIKTNTTIIQYYSDTPLNLTDNTLKTQFRAYTAPVTIGIEDVIEIIYEKPQNNLTIKLYKTTNRNNNKTNATENILVSNITTISLNNKRDISQLDMVSHNKSLEIVFNDETVATFDNISLTNVLPYIKLLDTLTSIRDFSIKNNMEPKTTKLTIPDDTPTTSYAAIYGAEIFKTIASYSNAPIAPPQEMNNTQNTTMQNLTGNVTLNGTMNNNNGNTSTDNISSSETKLSDEQLARLQDFFEREKLSWQNYTFTANFMDRQKNNTFIISLYSLNKTFYSIIIDEGRAQANITYTQNKTEQKINKTIMPKFLNKIVVSVNNDTLTVLLNDQTLFSSKAELTTNGILALDYQNITLINAQAENRDSNLVRIYKRQTYTECTPTLIKQIEYTGNSTIQDTQSKIFNGYVRFDDPFDTAKVQISLDNGQEIHFIVKNI